MVKTLRFCGEVGRFEQIGNFTAREMGPGGHVALAATACRKHFGVERPDHELLQHGNVM